MIDNQQSEVFFDELQRPEDTDPSQFHWYLLYCLKCGNNTTMNALPRDFLLPYAYFNIFIAFILFLSGIISVYLSIRFPDEDLQFDSVALVSCLAGIGSIGLGSKFVKSVKSNQPDRAFIHTVGLYYNILNIVVTIFLGLAIALGAFAFIFFQDEMQEEIGDDLETTYLFPVAVIGVVVFFAFLSQIQIYIEKFDSAVNYLI